MVARRWRRIVLGDVLAEHVLELRGRARACLAVEVAGVLVGSGRTAGYAIGEGRTSPWLEAIAGIRGDHVQAGLLFQDAPSDIRLESVNRPR